MLNNRVAGLYLAEALRTEYMYLLCVMGEGGSSSDNGELGQKDHNWAYPRSR
jgi:hypothetical protein